MPSGPPEDHAYWTKFGPTDSGDTNAIKFLEDRGYRLTTRWRWARPTLEHRVAEDEWYAINYLIMEWDFDGVVEGELDPNEKWQRKAVDPAWADELVPPERKRGYKGILFRHKKGGWYVRLFEVTHSENLERLTIYVHLWPHTFGGWARPVAMFDDPERFRRLL